MVANQRPVLVEAGVALLDHERELAAVLRLGCEPGEGGEAERPQSGVEVRRADRHSSLF